MKLLIIFLIQIEIPAWMHSGNAFIFNSENTAIGSTQNLVFTPKDSPYNKSYFDWTREWWQWHLSIPVIKENASLAHPRDNYSPEKCSWNQNSGPVWLLADGKDSPDLSTVEVRQCTVPQGKALLVQIVGSGCRRTRDIRWYGRRLLSIYSSFASR
jgi:hypothetical protein